MMDLAAINHVNRQVAIEAAAERLEPFIITRADADALVEGDLSQIKITNLGDYLPEGWERVSLGDHKAHSGARGINMGDNDGYGAFFVDKTGSGYEGEIALTLAGFGRALIPELGYAVIEEGQFQMKVGAFRRVKGG